MKSIELHERTIGVIMKKPKYEKVKIGNRWYTLKVADWAEDKKDWDLYDKDRKAYYEKFGP